MDREKPCYHQELRPQTYEPGGPLLAEVPVRREEAFLVVSIIWAVAHYLEQRYIFPTVPYPKSSEMINWLLCVRLSFRLSLHSNR